jgi:hypothetical protein
MVCSHSGGVDRVSLLAGMKVAGTWQVSSSARGKSHLRLGLCMSAVCFTVSPPYGDTQGGAFLDADSPKVSRNPRDHDAPDDWHKSRRLQLLFVLTAISSR